MSKKRNRIFTVIDIGSLAISMKIFQLSSQKESIPIEVESVRSYFPLGTQTYRNGVLSPEQVSTVCEILKGFCRKNDEYKAEFCICVATSAFREAKNQDYAVERIRLRTGLQVVILNNSMERFYRNLYVKMTVPSFREMSGSGTVLLDIGAGSIQSTVYNEASFMFSQNMLLGPLRIEDIYSGLERDSNRAEQILEEYISLVFEDYHAIAPKGVNYTHLIVFGEETGFMKQILKHEPGTYSQLTNEEFLLFYDIIRKLTPDELVLDYNIPFSTAALLWTSALLVKKMLEYGGFKHIHLPNVSLCDGIAYHFAAENNDIKLPFRSSEDILNAARNMGKRYRYDRKHSERVRLIAAEIFVNTTKFHGLSNRDGLLLEIAAILYEVGKHIQVSNYNRRSFHIINTTEILGIDRHEQEIIAYIAGLCNHQSLYDDLEYQNLQPDKKMLISALTSILRLADALEASRRQRIQSVHILMDENQFQIVCEHTEDISYECWEFDHKKDLFCEVFGVMPVLKTRRIS